MSFPTERDLGDVSAVTRLEIVDHTPCTACKGKCYVIIQGETKPTECPKCQGLGCAGRAVVFWDASKAIDLSLQDDQRTLKIFIKERGE